jgi:hypothetical protein
MTLGVTLSTPFGSVFSPRVVAARRFSRSFSSRVVMDNDYFLDLNEIIETVRTADVLTFRFVIVSQRLLVDGRNTEIDPPLVKLVAPAASAEERFRSLKRLRPRFKLPEKITSIWWPRYINSLVDSGIWNALVERLAGMGFPDAVQRCEEVLQELKDLERAEMRSAIIGEGYQTLWQSRG